MSRHMFTQCIQTATYKHLFQHMFTQRIYKGTCGSGWLGGVFSSTPVGGLPTNETTFATALKNGAGYGMLA